jgi:hypothetical protein
MPVNIKPSGHAAAQLSRRGLKATAASSPQRTPPTLNVFVEMDEQEERRLFHRNASIARRMQKSCFGSSMRALLSLGDANLARPDERPAPRGSRASRGRARATTHRRDRSSALAARSGALLSLVPELAGEQAATAKRIRRK